MLKTGMDHQNQQKNQQKERYYMSSYIRELIFKKIKGAEGYVNMYQFYYREHTENTGART